MIEDETVEPYVRWRKIDQQDAIFIPDIQAFLENVMPRYFRDMTKVHSQSCNK